MRKTRKQHVTSLCDRSVVITFVWQEQIPVIQRADWSHWLTVACAAEFTMAILLISFDKTASLKCIAGKQDTLFLGVPDIPQRPVLSVNKALTLKVWPRSESTAKAITFIKRYGFAPEHRHRLCVGSMTSCLPFLNSFNPFSNHWLQCVDYSHIFMHKHDRVPWEELISPGLDLINHPEPK